MFLVFILLMSEIQTRMLQHHVLIINTVLSKMTHVSSLGSGQVNSVLLNWYHCDNKIIIQKIKES